MAGSGNEKTILIFSCLIFIPLADGWAENKEVVVDQRISLGLTEVGKAEFLVEMRRMLVSIQGVISGIGEDNPEKIIKAARNSGNRMARSTPETIKAKTPQSFKEIGSLLT